MDRAGGDDEFVRRGHGRHDLPYHGEEFGLRQQRRVRLDLEGADAGGEVGDAVEPRFGDRLHQGVHPHAQRQVELHGAELDQEVVVAAPAVRHVAVAGQDPAVDDRGPGRGVVRHREEADRVPGRSWPSFQRSVETTVAGQTKPPREGPSGPRRTGMSPV